MRTLLPAAAALAACSAQPSHNEAVPADTSTASPSARAMPAASEPAASFAQAAVAPGELKTFGDWTVGCDNTALCKLASLGPETGAPPDVAMQLLRQPGPVGAIDLSFSTAQDRRPLTPVAVAVDGARIALPALNGPAAARVAAAMSNGRELTLLASGTRISLRGASAALRWIDAQQGRAGTVTALVAKGPNPAASVPERRAAPVIRAIIPTGAPAVPSERQLTAMRRQAACEDPAATSPTERYALGKGATLVAIPCSAGAYNLSSAMFILRGDAVEPARSDAPTGMNPDAPPDGPINVVNATWKGGELTTFAKGRGLGDCGVRQTFVWDGARLRLSEQTEMGECRGNPGFIPTWRAQVVRR